MIYWDLFLTFLKIGLFLVGGGYAAIPLIQSSVVEQQAWLSTSEFTDLISIAEMTPGPIAINAATFVGIRLGGIGGALAASFGCIVPSLLIASLLFFIYKRYHTLPFLQSILKTLRPVVVALIASAGVSMLLLAVFPKSSFHLTNMDIPACILFLAGFLLLRIKKWNPILIIGLSGVLYLGISLILA